MRFPNMNFHTHTTYCDGKETAEQMVQAAIAKGFTRLGFSGRGFNDFRPEDQEVWCMRPEDVPKYQAEVRALAEKYRRPMPGRSRFSAAWSRMPVRLLRQRALIM